VTTTNVVLLVRDRPELTRQAITTMITHAPPDSFNLTIVDDGSAAETHLTIVHSTMHSNVQVRSYILSLYPPCGIVGLARNLGILASERIFGRGEFLYLADNDAAYMPRWLETLTNALTIAEPHGVRLVGGYNHPFMGANTHLPLSIDVRTHDAVQGLSQLMRWETWEKYGPFDSHAQGTNQSEDWAYCQRIKAAGYPVGSVYPRVVLNCGLLDSYGRPCVGYDAVRAELLGEIKARGLEGKVYYPTVGEGAEGHAHTG
jgi:hypothetical protein